MKLFFKILSGIIGIFLCLVIVLKSCGKLENVQISVLSFVILLTGIGFIFGLPLFLLQATSLKLWDFEWKRELAKVQKKLRKYAIINSKGEIVKGTFRSKDFRIISFTFGGDIHLWFKHKPLYIEIRGIGSTASYTVDSEAQSNGHIYKCKMDIKIEATPGNEPTAQGVVIEAFIE